MKGFHNASHRGDVGLPLVMFLILFYGPIRPFRVLWIQPTMLTSHCKFLAQWFYSDQNIQLGIMWEWDNRFQPKEMGIQNIAL